jgi:hypothetical protein
VLHVVSQGAVEVVLEVGNVGGNPRGANRAQSLLVIQPELIVVYHPSNEVPVVGKNVLAVKSDIGIHDFIVF